MQNMENQKDTQQLMEPASQRGHHTNEVTAMEGANRRQVQVEEDSLEQVREDIT